MMSQVAMLKGRATELWAPLDTGRMPNTENLIPHFVNKYDDGRVAGIGAVAWYITLVTNTNAYPEAPTSWAALWDHANEAKLGLLELVHTPFLLEVTDKPYMDGPEALLTAHRPITALDTM